MTTEEIKIDDDFKVLIPKANDLKQFATITNPDPNAVDIYELERKRGNIPSQEMKQTSMNYNRSENTKGRGLYQIALRAERQALKDGFTRFWGNRQPALNNILEMIDYLPNARFGYLNKLIKQALSGIADGQKTITSADIEFVRTIWLNDQARRTLTDLLRQALDINKDGFSIIPTPSRSGVPYNDAVGINTGSYISLKNPGNVYLPITNDQMDRSDDEIINNTSKIIMKISDKMQELQNELESMQDLSSLYDSEIVDPATALGKTLLYLQDKVIDRHMKYRDVSAIADSIQKFVGLRKSRYLLSLGSPFIHRSARIPTLITPPSATFCVRNIVPLTTNAFGNVSWVYNPFFLSLSTVTSMYVNNNSALTGLASDDHYTGVSVGQTLPAAFYVKYRLVSAGMRIYCYPSSNNDNGILTNSVTFDTVGSASVGGINSYLAQYGNFALTENGYFKKTITVASREVQEHVYIPVDESFWDYCDISLAPRNGFAWTGYITGAQPSTSIARLEIVANYEALVDNEFTDYLPSESPVEEVEPKIIFGAIQRIKEDGGAITSKKLNDVLQETNLAVSPDSSIALPPHKSDISRTKQSLNDLGQMAKDIIKTTVPIIKDTTKKESFLTSLFNKVSPYLGTILGAATTILPTLLKF